MRTLRYFGTFLLSVLIVFVISSCGGDDDPIAPTPTPTPTPVVAKIEIPETENTKPVFSTEGGNATVTFSTTQAWTATITGSGDNSWLTVTPMNGSAGKTTLSITSKGNDTTDDRSATITIKCGTASQSISVTQKQKDALTVSSGKMEIDSDGGKIQVEVKANINFSVETDVDWITQADTRAMKATNLSFTIAKNENTSKREGHITITSGALSETITVYQSEFTPMLSLAKQEYLLGVDGGQVKVEVKSNVELTIALSDNTWIKQSGTEKVSDDVTIYEFTIAKNDTYDGRKAEIVFANEKYGLNQKVIITQKQEDELIISSNYIEVVAEGTKINVEVKANIDFSVNTDVDWISQTNTRALKASNLTFVISENTDMEKREGHIIISGGGFSETVTISQSEATPYMNLTSKEFELDANGGDFSVEMITNVEVKVSLPKNSWIKQSSTNAVSDNEIIYVFTISNNDTYDERKTEIVFTNEKYGLTEKVMVTQKQLDAIIVNKKEFSFSIEGGSFDVEVKSNVDFGIDINAGWIWYSTTRALNTSQLHFDVGANDSAENRQAVITLYAGDTKQEISVQQRGVVFVSSVQLNKTSLELLEGETAQLTATISPSNADHKELQWYSQNDWVASVDENGLITARNEGTTIIEVYADNWRIKAECQVTVKKHSFTNGNENFGNEQQDW